MRISNPAPHPAVPVRRAADLPPDGVPGGSGGLQRGVRGFARADEAVHGFWEEKGGNVFEDSAGYVVCETHWGKR